VTENPPTIRFKSWVVDQGDFILELFGIELGPWRARVYMKEGDKLIPIWSLGPVYYTSAWNRGMEILEGLREARKAA
jgi:hypothetical protein